MPEPTVTTEFVGQEIEILVQNGTVLLLLWAEPVAGGPPVRSFARISYEQAEKAGNDLATLARLRGQKLEQV